VSSVSKPRVSLLAVGFRGDDDDTKHTVTLLTLDLAGLVRIDGVELHRDRASGRHFLRFPAWIDAFGQRHSIVRPTTREVRAAILQQVLAALDAGFPNPNHKESP
jgi:hypothetical protein